MTAPAFRIPDASFTKYIGRILPVIDGLEFWHELGVTLSASTNNLAPGGAASNANSPIIAANYATLALASRVISADFVPIATGVTYAGVFKRDSTIATRNIVGNGTGTTTPGGDTFSQRGGANLDLYATFSVYTGAAYTNMVVDGPSFTGDEADGDWLFALISRQATNAKTFLGRSGALVTQTGTTGWTVTPGPNNVFIGPGFGSSGSGDYAWGAAWNRGISDAEALAVYEYVKTVMAERSITVN